MHNKLQNVKNFLFDMDGTIYLGGKILPAAKELLSYLQQSGRSYLFLTNNSSADRSYYQNKLQNMGIECSIEQILTSGEATVRYLHGQQSGARIYLLGMPSLEQEFRDWGFELTTDRPDYVVLGFDRTLTYDKLATACNLLRQGVPFVATHADINCPTEDGYIPDCGAMLALIKASCGAEPKVIGKPNVSFLQMAMDKLGCKREELAMVGDRLYTDILMAKEAKVCAIAVLTGETTVQEIERSDYKPDLVCADLNVLLSALQELDATSPRGLQP